jgi:hypothetical protein
LLLVFLQWQHFQWLQGAVEAEIKVPTVMVLVVAVVLGQVTDRFLADLQAAVLLLTAAVGAVVVADLVAVVVAGAQVL